MSRNSRPASTPPCQPRHAVTSTGCSATCLPCPTAPPPPPSRRQRIVPWLLVLAFLALLAGATIPFYPLYHVPWFLFAIVGFFIWRRAVGHQHHRDGGTRPSSVMDH